MNAVHAPLRSDEARGLTPRPAPDEAWDERWGEQWEARWAGHGRIVRWTLTVVALAVCVVVATIVVAQVDAAVEGRRSDRAGGQEAASPSSTGGGDGASRTSATLELVRGWDRRRALAWRSGDPDALRALYARGVSAGRADVAHLRRWRAQGWTLENVAPQLLGVVEVDREPRRWVVDVTDRLSGVRAVQGKASVTLPAGGISTRRIVFVHRGGAWRVEQVSAQKGPVS